MFYEQTNDTREMKEVVLSADGELSLYLVPADVADNLATVANEFAFNYVCHGEKSGKFLNLCGEQYGAVFDETGFIEYLNTVYGALDSLSKKGWITVHDDSDVRKKEYIITDEGRHVAERELKRIQSLACIAEEITGG